MSEQGGQQKGKKGQQGGSDSPLKTDRGQTSIQDGVVAKVAGIAAQEVEGIRMGGGGSQAASNIMSSLTGRRRWRRWRPDPRRGRRGR